MNPDVVLDLKFQMETSPPLPYQIEFKFSNVALRQQGPRPVRAYSEVGRTEYGRTCSRVSPQTLTLLFPERKKKTDGVGGEEE